MTLKGCPVRARHPDTVALDITVKSSAPSMFLEEGDAIAQPATHGAA